MRHLLFYAPSLILLALLLLADRATRTLAKPAQSQLLIESAPSVVSYQGSTQTQTRFVIAPMGRALGYVEPTNVNRTFHINAKPRHAMGDDDANNYEFLNLSPVYVHV